MFFKCEWFGHNYVPYRYNVVEYIPTKKDTPYNREGAMVLSHVYCVKCGEVKELVNISNVIKHKDVR